MKKSRPDPPPPPPDPAAEARRRREARAKEIAALQAQIDALRAREALEREERVKAELVAFREAGGFDAARRVVNLQAAAGAADQKAVRLLADLVAELGPGGWAADDPDRWENSLLVIRVDKGGVAVRVVHDGADSDDY